MAVEEWVLEHLGELSPRTREVLRPASVLGDELEAGRLADLSGRPVTDVVAALQEAIEAGVVVVGDPLVFRNAVVREEIGGTVPATLRRTLRKRAAELSLAQGTPVAHVALALAETAEPGDGDAAVLLRRALTELAPASPDAALPLARRAVDLAPPGSVERAEAVADALPLLTRVGRGEEARRLAGTVLDGALPAAVEARVRLGAAMAAMQGPYDEMLRHSRAGSGLDGIPDGLRARLMALHCLAALLTGDVPAAERLLAPSTQAAVQAEDQAALALARTAGSLIRAFRLDFTGAERLATEAVAIAPDSSTRHFPAVCRALLHGMTGRLDEALRESADGVAAARRPGHAPGLALWLAARSRLLLAAGRLAEARAEAEAALALTGESGADGVAALDALSVLGRVDASTGTQHPISPRFAEAMACGPRTVPAWPADPADDPALVRLALRGGRTDQAAAVVAEAERRAVLNPGTPLFEAVAAHARGLLDDDVQPILRAVEILEGIEFPLALASAREDAGKRFMETGRDRAAEHLAHAESIYVRTGARKEAERVRRRLGGAGRRRRTRRPRTTQGWGALTPAERRVASLVAEGATNRRAAEQLFLSPATIGTHVMHIYSKLGVNSRVELARAYMERREVRD
ncbi:helix-turn-helix transcriptional regulator [Spirillospora sp. NPDC052269]